MVELWLQKGIRASLLNLISPSFPFLLQRAPSRPLTSPFMAGTPCSEAPVVVLPALVQGCPPVGDELRQVGRLAGWFWQWPRNSWAHHTVHRGLSWQWLHRPTRLLPQFT